MKIKRKDMIGVLVIHVHVCSQVDQYFRSGNKIISISHLLERNWNSKFLII